MSSSCEWFIVVEAAKHLPDRALFTNERRQLYFLHPEGLCGDDELDAFLSVVSIVEDRVSSASSRSISSKKQHGSLCPAGSLTASRKAVDTLGAL